MPECTSKLSADRAMDLLASDCRRRLLRHLLEGSGQAIDREELAFSLHTDLDRDADALELELAHRHLPKFDECGVVEYDHRSGSVRPTATAEALAPLLEACERFVGKAD